MRFEWIQACRAIAALLVLSLHLSGAVGADKYFGITGPYALLYFGHSGVEFFFVLSGFIITYVHWGDFGRPAALSGYARKRLLRIYPTFWLVFGVVYLAGLPLLPAWFWLNAKQLAWTLALLPQASSDPAIGTESPVLVVAWSLQYEVLFYLAMALFIVNRWAGIAASAALLLNWAGCEAGMCVAGAPWLQTTFWFLFPIGAFAAWVARTKRPLGPPRLLLASGLALYAATALCDDLTHERLTASYGVASGLLVLGFVRGEAMQAIGRAPRWLVSLGDASYALYLVHFPLVSACCKLAVRIGLKGAIGACVAAPLIVAICIGTALLIHRYFERPLLERFAAGARRAAAAQPRPQPQPRPT